MLQCTLRFLNIPTICTLEKLCKGSNHFHCLCTKMGTYCIYVVLISIKYWKWERKFRIKRQALNITKKKVEIAKWINEMRNSKKKAQYLFDLTLHLQSMQSFVSKLFTLLLVCVLRLLKCWIFYFKCRPVYETLRDPCLVFHAVGD